MKIASNKILLAQGLRDILLFKLSRTSEKGIVLYDCYQNCREQGFTVSLVSEGRMKSVTFSEARSSSNIVVYKNNEENQGLDEDSRKNATYFDSSAYSEVVEFCYDFLTTL